MSIPTIPKFSFTFFRFTGSEGSRTTEIVRDFNQADGMRSLIDRSQKHIELAVQRVNEWATSKSLSICIQEPFPSEKHPGRVWLEVRFGGLTL
jgi:hypothetical protein